MTSFQGSMRIRKQDINKIFDIIFSIIKLTMSLSNSSYKKKSGAAPVELKMNFLFCCLAIVVSSRPQDPLENSDLASKLDKYQIATGISDDQRNEIWDKTMLNCKFSHILST